MSDIIFWYTGAAVWAVIGAICAMALLLALIAGCARAHRLGYKWLAISAIRNAGMSVKDAKQTMWHLDNIGAPRGSTQEDVNEWLGHLGHRLRAKKRKGG